MHSIRLASVLAVASALFSTVSAASASPTVQQIPSATKTVAASSMATVGCFDAGTAKMPLDDHGPGPFISPGECQQICLGLEQDVLGLSEGDHCWCGDMLPPLNTRIDNSSCSTPCAGYSDLICKFTASREKRWGPGD